MVKQWTLINLLVAAALWSGVHAQSGKYCMQFSRRDTLDIWYANTESQLCKDQEYAAPRSPRSEDLKLVVINNTVRVVVDKGYTTLDENFLTARDTNFSVLVYSAVAKERLVLTFDVEQADKNSSLIRTMSYSEEGEGHNKIRRWTIYLLSNNLVNECVGCRDLLVNLFQVSYYVFLLLHVFLPDNTSAEFVILYVCFTNLLQIPLQYYVLYFGYMANFTIEAIISVILASLVNKLPKSLSLSYSISAVMIIFYVLGRPYELPLTILECLTTLIPAYLAIREQKTKIVNIDEKFRRPHWQLLWITVVILVPLVSYSPLVVLESIVYRRPGYSGAGKTWWERFNLARINAGISLIACLFIPIIDQRRSDIVRKVACKYDLLDEDTKLRKNTRDSDEGPLSRNKSPMPSVYGKEKSKIDQEELEVQERQIPIA